MKYITARVLATEAARELIEELRQNHGPLVFFLCDDSAASCYAADDFNVSATDIYLGNLDGVPFYVSTEQYAYWKNTQFVIDAARGNGGLPSLQNGTGTRFLTRPLLSSDEKSTTTSGPH